jgi:hypothetical protein
MIDRIKQFNDRSVDVDLHSDTSMMSDSDKQHIIKALNKEWTNPKFKMRWFVGQAQVTIYAKYRQFLMELKSREEGIEDLEYKMEQWSIDIARHEMIASEAVDDLDKRMAKLEIKKLSRDLSRSRRIVEGWYLERQLYCDLINEFLASPEALLPDNSGRTYADIINTDEEDVYEELLWTHRLAKQAACDLMFYGKINSGNMDAILSMHPDQQAQTFALATNFSMQVQSYLLELQDQAQTHASLGKPFNNGDLALPRAFNRAPPAEDITKIDNPQQSTEIKDMLNVYNI